MDKREIQQVITSRKEIGIRLAYTIFYLIVFEILKTVVQLAVLFQYIYLLVTRRPNEPIRKFSNKVASYGYRIMRYVTLNDNQRPFPLSDFPEEVERPVDPVTYN
jgi:membrane peptidoglycan carboxypeptidase